MRTRFNSNIEPFVILVIGTIKKVTDFLENVPKPKSAKNSALIRKNVTGMNPIANRNLRLRNDKL